MSKLTPHQRKLKEQRKLLREKNELTLKGAEIAIHTLFIMLPYCMMYYYGWKNKRLCRLIKQMRVILTLVSDEGLELRRLADELEHDCKIKFDFETHMITDLKGGKL